MQPQMRGKGRRADSRAQDEEEEDDDGAAAGAVPASAVTYPGVTVTIAPLDADDEAPRRERHGAARTSHKR